MKSQKTSILPIRLKRKARKTALSLQQCDLGIAVTLVESFFRPFIIRICEYIVWFCLRTLSLNNSRLTIGRSQIRSDIVDKYVQRRFDNPSAIDIILKLEQVTTASEIAKYYISSKDKALPISVIYTGKFNKYYEALVSGVLEEMRVCIENQQ